MNLLSNDMLQFLAVSIPSWVQSLAIEDYLEIGAGFFSLVLFSLTIYASYRRKQSSLLPVAIAFLLFFVEELFDILPLSDPITNFVSDVLDFTILSLFFVAIVVRPRRKIAIEET